MPGDARGSVCVAAICRCTSLVCSVVQEYGAAARCHHSKWRHDSAPMNQNSTAAHRPAAPLRQRHLIQPCGLQDSPDRDSDRDATSHPRDENPASRSPPDGKHPGTACNSPSPVLKAPPGKMWHTAELVNRPPANQPPRRITAACQRQSGLFHSARQTTVRWTSATISPCISARSQSSATSGNTPPAHRRYSRRKISFPLRCSHHEAARLRWRTSPGVRQKSLILSLSWDSLRKFVNGKEAAKVADVIAKLTAAQAFAAFILRDIGGRLVIFIRDRRTVITALITAIGPGAGISQHDAPRKNSAVRFRRRGQYKRGTHRAPFAALLDAPAAITSCSGSASLFPLTKFTASRKRA